jgi:uncharacterized membrane protein YqaE (UPF0057 family)
MKDTKEMAVSPTMNKVLAFFFPPISILMRYGFGGKLIINILLTMVGWIPGVIHAFLTLPGKNATTA